MNEKLRNELLHKIPALDAFDLLDLVLTLPEVVQDADIMAAMQRRNKELAFGE